MKHTLSKHNLSHTDNNTITNSLVDAAIRYKIDAETFRLIANACDKEHTKEAASRLADQFDRQRQESMRLAEIVEKSEWLTVNMTPESLKDIKKIKKQSKLESPSSMGNSSLSQSAISPVLLSAM